MSFFDATETTQQFNSQISQKQDPPLKTQSTHNITVVENFSPIQNLTENDVTVTGHIADGAMCRVFSGQFYGTQCAIKLRLPAEKNPNHEEIKRALSAELNILQQLKHPHVVAYFGAGMNVQREMFLVLEMFEACLANELLKTRNGCSKGKLGVLGAMKWALQIGLGLEYLHNEAIPNCRILHRDLKPANIGVGAGGILKIMDFGLAAIVDKSSSPLSDFYTMTGNVGSPRYMAPEVAFNQPYNEKADVYSFCMIFWEMLSSSPPFAHVSNSEELKVRLAKSERPVLNKKWSQELHIFFPQCWDNNKDFRLSSKEAVNFLQSMIEEYQEPAPTVSPLLTAKKSLLKMIGVDTSDASSVHNKAALERHGNDPALKKNRSLLTMICHVKKNPPHTRKGAENSGDSPTVATLKKKVQMNRSYKQIIPRRTSQSADMLEDRNRGITRSCSFSTDSSQPRKGDCSNQNVW